MSRLLLPRLFVLVSILGTFSSYQGHAQETAPTRRILALGGGGREGFNGALPRYFASLTGKRNPLIVYLPTAVGDTDRSIVQWYETMNEIECRPRHLRVFSESPRMRNFESTLLSADAIYVGGGNTLNMLAIWKAQGIDKILRKAYERGTVLGGESAGMICWFEQGVTDSRPEKLTSMECLGFLPGSACPHYLFEFNRQFAYQRMIKTGEVKAGIACPDFVALLYENEKLERVFSIGPYPKMAAFQVRLEGKKVEEVAIDAQPLPILPHVVVDIWPGKPADDVGIEGKEYFRDLIVKGKPHTVDGKPTRWLTNVSKPTLSIYRPERNKDAGAAVLIAPGGGYHNLGWDVEGEEIAAWLNSVGITGIILKYRCPRRPGDAKGVPPIGPLKDAQRAISLVRANARDWNIDPQRIGMVGFSAGGHLVGATCTNFEERAYKPVDDIDKVSCRPDFGIMCYSGYFKHEDGLSPTVKTPKNCPPLLFVHATDDAISDAEHSVTFYLALRKAKIDTQIHLYAKGGHGFGVRKGSPCASWTDLSLGWMRDHGILKRP